MAATRAKTPDAPSSSIRTPPTPRLGYGDDYQPYAPRKSARVSERSRGNAALPPQSSHQTRHHIHSTPRSKKASVTTSLSSPQTAPKKLSPQNSLTMSGRRVSGALNYDTTASAASALGLPTPKIERKVNSHSSTAALLNTGMLPTPEETPAANRPTDIAPAAVAKVARKLFPIHPPTDEDVMPSPKKKSKRHTGFTLDSFQAEEDSGSIEIFTDSVDRCPEVDLNDDNPFYGEAATVLPEPVKRTSKRRKISVEGEKDPTIEQLEKRDDGMLYVFRGKYKFKKFGDIDSDEGSVPGAEDSGDDDHAIIEDDLEDISPSLRRPLTRSSITPRLLFPSSQQRAKSKNKAKKSISRDTTDDEEADTDIEVSYDDPASPAGNRITASKSSKLFTPPATLRATRSKNMDMSSSPAGRTSADESFTTSPIDGELPYQLRNGTPSKRGKKRTGESLTRGGIKKVRG